MKLFKKAKKGFTLVELVVVIAVIAILSAVSVGAYFGITDSANNSRLEQEAAQMHTAIQAVALAPSDNHTLTKDGLTVKDVDVFEAAIEENIGSDIEVLKTDATYIARPTIVLKTNAFVKTEAGAPVVYKTFEYYTHEIGGKKLVLDVVTGEFNHESSDVKVDVNGADVSASTLYFKAPQFAHDVYAYLWGGEGESKVENAEWPGVAINTYAKVLDIWAFESSSVYDHVKLSWQVGDANTPGETEDIALPNADANTPYYDNGWKALPEISNANTTGKTVYFNHNTFEEVYAYAFTYNDDKNAPWPGVKMTRDETRLDKIASYTFDNDYYTIIFNNGLGTQTDNLLLKDVDFENNKVFYNFDEETWTTIPDDAEIEEPETRRVHFSNVNWASTAEDKIYAYAWKDENKNAEWPGVEMSRHETVENLFYIDVLASFDSIIFNNGTSSQTGNLTFDGYDAEAGKTYYDITAGEWTTVPTEIVVPEQKTLGIVGTFNGWNDENHLLETTDGNVYTITIDLPAAAEFKFRVNRDWAEEYNFNDITGNDGHFEAKDNSEKPNIRVLKEGTYAFTVTLSEDKEISFEFTAPHVHEFDATGKCSCDYQCPHTTYTNGVCDECNMICSHTYVDGVCSNCSFACTHEEYTDGKCNECNYVCPHDVPNYEQTCTECGEPNPNYVEPTCDHDWNNAEGKCSKCSETHNHKDWNEGACGECGYQCLHENYDKGLCTTCGLVQEGKRIIYCDLTGEDNSDAWFQAWTWGSSSPDSWVTLVKLNGDSNNHYYIAVINEDCTGMKVLRKGPSHAADTWNSWNNTGDVTIPSDKNCWSWDGNCKNNVAGSWSTYSA